MTATISASPCNHLIGREELGVIISHNHLEVTANDSG